MRVLALTILIAAHALAQPVTLEAPGVSLSPVIDPRGVCIDEQGLIYVAERAAHRISVFDASGAPVRTIGGFGHDDGQLDRPEDVAVDADGRIYVADTGNHRIQIFDADGAFIAAWGTRGGMPGMLEAPCGIDVKDDVVAVADRAAGNIQLFTTEGEIRHRYRGGLQHDDALRRPANVCIGDDLLFVADAERDAVMSFEPSGRSRQIGQWGVYPGLLASPMGIDLLGDRLVIADTRNNRIQILEPDGKAVSQFDGLTANRAGVPLDRPTDLAVGDDIVVVVEPHQNRCRIFNIVSGAGPVVWSPARSVAGAAIDAAGDVIAFRDEGYETLALYHVGASSHRLTDIGARGQFVGQLMNPGGFVVDDGFVHVADTGNGWIQVFALNEINDYDPLAANFHRAVILQARLPQDAINDLDWLIRPDDLARDAHGRWLVLDARNASIFVLDASYQYLDRWAPDLDEPVEIAAHGDSLYVLDAGTREVVVINAAGDVTRRHALPAGALLTDLAVNDRGVFVTDLLAGVHHVAPGSDQPHTLSIDRHARLIGAAALSENLFVVDAASHELVVLDADNDVVERITPTPAGLMPDEPNFPAPLQPDEHGWREMRTADDVFIVRWRPSPADIPLNEPFRVEIHVLDAQTGQPPDDRVGIGVDAVMPHHRHGMIDLVRLRRRGKAVFTGADLRLHMSGAWIFTVDVEQDGVIRRAQCTVHLQ